MPLYVPPSAFSAAWGLKTSWTYASAVPEVDFTDLGDSSEILILCRSITKSVTGEINVRFSVDNGSTFFSGASDYVTVGSNGGEGSANSFGLHNTNATAARSGSCLIIGANIDGIHKQVLRLTRPGDALDCRFVGSTSPINAVRVFPGAGGNFTGGTIQILTR